MNQTLHIASAQINAHVGDLWGNIDKVRAAYTRAKSDGADILVLPEQIIIGYPAEDLVLKPAAIADCKRLCEDFAKLTKGGPAVVFNAPWMVEG